MRLSLTKLATLLGGGEVVWSEIIPREQWRGARSTAAIEMSRRRINRSLQKFTAQQGLGFIRHSLLGRHAYGNFELDGVHLSDLGMDVFLLNIKVALEGAGCK